MISHSKLIAGELCLALGLFLLMTAGCKSPSKNPIPENLTPQNPARLDTSSGKIELRFKEFQQAKDLLAVFELANQTTTPILYETYSNTDKPEKRNFCQLVATQTGIAKQRAVSDCSYAKTITLQALDPGERVSLAVPKWEAKETLTLSSDAPEIATKLGFELFVGPMRQKQIIWSDEIVFPKTISLASR